jgi:hypothetical protein
MRVALDGDVAGGEAVGGRWRVSKVMTCPTCGGEDFEADYYQAVKQGCRLYVGADGKPYADDWDGCVSYDDGCSQDERFVCVGCGHEIVVGSFEFKELAEPKHSGPGRAVSGELKTLALLVAELADVVFAVAQRSKVHYADQMRAVEVAQNARAVAGAVGGDGRDE